MSKNKNPPKSQPEESNSTKIAKPKPIDQWKKQDLEQQIKNWFESDQYKTAQVAAQEALKTSKKITVTEDTHPTLFDMEPQPPETGGFD